MPVEGIAGRSPAALPSSGDVASTRLPDDALARRLRDVALGGRERTQLPAILLRGPQPASPPDGGASTPFIAQLLFQSDRFPAAAGEAPRRQEGAAEQDADRQARRSRGAALLRDGSPERAVAAYQRAAEASRAYATARYGVARDSGGVYLFDPGAIDIIV